MSKLITAETFSRDLDDYGQRPAYMENVTTHDGHWTILNKEKFMTVTRFGLYRFWDSIPDEEESKNV